MKLLPDWRSDCRTAGATADDSTVEAAGRDLLARWAEPHRHYHGTAHLATVLTVLRAHDAPAVVRLAAWYHDAVYDPRAPGDANERTSAALAGAGLAGLGVPAAATAEVVRLVLVTAGHEPAAGDLAGALLCAADLAVLARPEREYDAYAAAVRREYAHVPDDAFRAGRAAVLEHLLGLPALYRHPALAAAWEQPARANLRRELAALSSAAPGPP